ncbi:MAG: hypothetical protein AABY22_22050 [Nanoarchaeota archaeon]
MNHYQSKERKGVAEEGEWIDQDLAVKADTPLIDSATGKKIIIRKFEFEWDKKIKLQDKMNAQYDKQAFFNSHAKYIKDFLWKDGLSVLENQDPKMIFNEKGYVIAIACEAKLGVSIFEKGMTLQDILKKKYDKKAN